MLTVFQLADIDRCSTGVCGDNGVCSNTVGSFNCICNGGYDLNESDICTGSKVFYKLTVQALQSP